MLFYIGRGDVFVGKGGVLSLLFYIGRGDVRVGEGGSPVFASVGSGNIISV